MQLLAALSSTVFVSLLSLLGVLFLVLQKHTFDRIVTYTLAFSSGVLLGSAFFELLPESYMRIPNETFSITLAGIIVFFVLEKALQWHHHIEGDHAEDDAAVAYLSLVGDSIHNFTDGVLIGVSYLISVPVGIVTTIGVIAHEVPHELADFTILIFGGFSPKKAILYNFVSALTAIVGTIVVLVLSAQIGTLVQYLLPFAAGNFIYIALSDLVPELHKKRRSRTSFVQVLLMVAGIIIIFFISSSVA